MHYELSETAYRILLAELKKVNRKAEKIGAVGVQPQNVTSTLKIKQEGDIEYYEKMVSFDINVEEPVVDGYRVIATLDNKEGKNIIYYTLGNSDDEHDLTPYHERIMCDHCGHNRLRRTTYILQNEKGEYLQVGKTCLDDFVQGDIRHLILHATLNIDEVELEKKAREYKKSEKGKAELEQQYFFGLELFIAGTLYEIKHNGGYKRAVDGVQSTGDRVWNTLLSTKATYGSKENYENRMDLIKKIIDWAKAFDGNTSSILHNYSVIAHRNIVNFKERNFASSMVHSYLKQHNQQQEQPKPQLPLSGQLDGGLSKYVGKIGDEIRFVAVVKNIRQSETKYGLMTFITFEDFQFNNYVWATTSKHGLAEGNQYLMTAKIKFHNEFRGVKQTNISYVKVVEEYKKLG